MGRAIVRAASESSDTQVGAGLASATSTDLGKDVGEHAGLSALGVRVTSELQSALAQCDVAIDFSNASATAANVAACRAARRALVIGTTGFSDEALQAVNEAAAEIPVLVAPNTSLGITLLIEMVRAA